MSELTLPVGERDHAQGPENAPVTLVEYGDYECPYCGDAYVVVKQLQEQMGGKLRFVFRNFPLTQMHPHAAHAAESAEIAGAQGKFWEMHDALYEHQKALDDRRLTQYAQSLGLDAQKFEQELAAGAQTERVREDFLSGVRSGVNGTPTFFINGLRYEGDFDADSLLTTLQEARQ